MILSTGCARTQVVRNDGTKPLPPYDKEIDGEVYHGAWVEAVKLWRKCRLTKNEIIRACDEVQ